MTPGETPGGMQIEKEESEESSDFIESSNTSLKDAFQPIVKSSFKKMQTLKSQGSSKSRKSMKNSFKNNSLPNSPNGSILNQPLINYALERKKTI